MTDATKQMRAFWLSWIHFPSMGAFTLHSPWWISGSFGASGSTLCAAVYAEDEIEAKWIVKQAYDDPPSSLSWRFCNEQRGPDWSPFNDRFPKADWMEWPAVTI